MGNGLCRVRVSWLGFVLLGTLFLAPAQSQIVPDPGAVGRERPTVLQAGNGVPLVNIQTSSAAGVSRNRYRQFDVNGEGAILNNARGSVQTQLGGWVSGNPWLAGGTARVILNEVNSVNPSHLNGYVEIAGSRAQLVIANPAGIGCDGCGFINAHRATLSTGTPILEHGALTGYRVQDGIINIHGQGLDARDANYTDLIARSVQVNAGIWAQQLGVTTGVQLPAQQSTQSTAPAFSLDVAALGGMYAQRIVLLGTEGGVGVRNAGHIGAPAGQLVVSADGRLHNTGTLQATDTRIQVAELANHGIIDGANTHITTHTLDNAGSGRIYGDQVAIAATNVINRDADNQSAVIAARERLDIGAALIHNREQALLFSAGTGDKALNLGGALDANYHATGHADQIINASATIESLGGITLAATDFLNTNLHFASELVQTAGPTQRWLIQPQGDPNKYELDDYRWESWSRAGRYRNKATGQTVKNWTQYHVTQTEYETQVTQSAPGVIRAGGDIALVGETLTNDKSHILAGGALAGDLTNLTNIAALGEHVSHQAGTSQYTRSRWRGGFRRYHQRKWDAVLPYTPADVVQTIDLGVTQTMAQVAAQPASHTIPASSLFMTAPASHNYLIETDPRFSNYRHWLSSDYLLNQLGYDPALIQKRLGDGFYEQRLITEQLAQLTGRRFLEGYVETEAQYQALLAAGAHYGKVWDLRPGVALSADQIAQLTQDMVWLEEKSVRLSDGTTTQALVPQVYLRPNTTGLASGGTLIAANHIELNLSHDLTNTGTVAAATAVRITGENLRNLGGTITGNSVALSARDSIDNLGGVITAHDALVLNAHNDINLASTTHSDHKTAGASDFSRTHIDRTAKIVTNGALLLNAGRDINLTAAHIQNAGDDPTLLIADRDINLTTLTVSEQENIVGNAHNYLKQGYQQDIGTRIHTQGDVTLQAYGNLTARAADVSSDGQIAILAQGDIDLQAGAYRRNWQEGRQHKDRGLLGGKQTTTRDSLLTSTAQGTTVSGHTVTLQGENITLTGSNVVSDVATSLIAHNNLNINAGTNTHQEDHYRYTKKSGLLTGGGIGVTIGTQMVSQDEEGLATTAAVSTVGSLEGDVWLKAGQHYTQTGSDVLAPQGNIDIQAQNISILESRETSRTREATQFKQSGVSVSLSSPVMDAWQATRSVFRATETVKDGRMQALGALTTAMSLGDLYEAGKQTVDTAAGLIGMGSAQDQPGVGINITLGSSRSQSRYEQMTDTTHGSLIQASGDVNLIAAGAGTDSNLLVRGSQVNAGQRLTLLADNRMDILAASNDATMHSQNKSSSASVGVGFNVSGQQNGITIHAAAAQGRGKANGTDLWYTASALNAADTLWLTSGHDSNLYGATLAANTVKLDVGGDLNIASLQSVSHYASRQTNSNAGVSLCIPPICAGTWVSGSVGMQKAKANSDYRGVETLAGIRAGDGGFQINVKNNTHLEGAVIASSEQAIAAGKNLLETGTLTTQDLFNHAKASAKSSGFALSSDWLQQGKYGVAKALIQNTASNGNANEESSGYTKTAISEGVIVIRSIEKQNELGTRAEEVIASLNRDTGNHHMAARRLNVEALEEQAQAEEAIKSAFMKEIFKYGDDAYRTMFVVEHGVYKVERDADGELMPRKLTVEEKRELQASTDTIRLGINGIFNGVDAAAGYAEQHNDDALPGHFIHFPKSDTVIGELMVAGYQKFLENDFWGLTNSAVEVKDFMRTNGQTGLVFDAHSRGAMTIGNSLESLMRDGANGILTGTDINLYGPAYSAQKTANMLYGLSNGVKNYVNLQNHADDFVGMLIGGNPATYSTRPEGSNKLSEGVRMILDDESVHNCYGNGRGTCEKTYGEARTVTIKTQVKK